MPDVTIPLGTVNPFPSDDATGGGGDGGSPGGGGGNVGSSDALSTMLGTPWGATAVANALALGVNPSALAATCVLESGCQNLGGRVAQGAFQMIPSTYTAMINAAVAQNPNLASQIVPGLAGQMDPATESIASAEYLLQGARYLQNQGISDPTVLDVRSYYNFGPGAGALIANAPGNASMSAYLSPTVMQQNGITPSETVDQWRASVSSKIGTAAGQSVLT